MLKFGLWFYHAVPLVLWLGFVFLPFILAPPMRAPMGSEGFMINMFLGNLLLLAAFYFHFYAIYPLLKLNRGQLWYLSALTVCLFLYLLLSGQLRPEFPLPPGNYEAQQDVSIKQVAWFPQGPQLYFHIVRFLIVMICSYSYGMFIDNAQRERTLADRENAHLKTELSFLRSQISPHFMFNVLNSMVSLARKKSELLEVSLINMSSLMRYMLYENTGNTVNLQTEIEYLKNYIELQLLRYGDTVKLNFYLNGSLEGYRIEPMLLIPFVENAFKHGISTIDNPIIDISINMDQKHSTLEFIVMNSISPLTPAGVETGIGLSNVKRRLAILYPDSHLIDIRDDSKIFKATISIKLSA